MVAVTLSVWRTVTYGVFDLVFLLYMFFVGRRAMERLHRMRGMLDAEGPVPDAAPVPHAPRGCSAA